MDLQKQTQVESPRAAEIVYRVAEEMSGEQPDMLPPDCVRLNTGVVIRIIGIPAEAFEAIHREFADVEPQPPIVRIPQKGRDEPNPSDPAYIKKHERWAGEFTFALLLAIYAFGAELVSVPDDFPGPYDPDWLDECKISRLSSGNSNRARFVDWLRYRAMLDRTLDTKTMQERAGKDKTAILYAAGRALGTVESDVQNATKSV